MYLDGKYYFDMKIQEYSQFLQPTDVAFFAMTENCGAAGVVFDMVFQTRNRKIVDLIIENNEVVFELGETAEKALSYKAYISEHPSKETSADETTITITFSATSIDLKFYTTRASETVFGTSLDMIKRMAEVYLGKDVDVQIEKPAEVEHNWLRSYETGAVTMMEAWLHMNLSNTTPILWIDTTNVCHISDIESIKKAGVKYRFVPAQISRDSNENSSNTLRYLNDFDTISYKFDTNLITGKNTIVNISNIESGDDTVNIPETKPDIASTAKVESGSVGNKVVDNKYQTDNVHSKFMVSYYANKLRLIQLSSHIGNLELNGVYPNLNICDFVEVTGCQPAYSGRYLVNTKVTTFALNSPVKTIVAVCRDNTNSIEDSDITPKSQVTVTNQQLTDIMQSVRTLRRVTVMATKVLDGTSKTQIMAYCKTFKYNALNSFQVMGTPLNLNSSLEIMQSLKNMGINIINHLIDKFIPYPYNLLLRDAVLQGFNFKRLLSKLAYQFLPPFLRDLFMEILALLADLANLADNLHKQNKKKLSDYNYSSGGYSSEDNSSQGNNASGSPSDKEDNIPSKGDNNVTKDPTKDNTETIKKITDEIIDNVDGVDIPIPDIKLDESESLTPENKLKEIIAERVVDYLDGQGYLVGVGKPAFLAILLGKKSLDFNTIKLINGNIGNMLYARYWGTYSGEVTKFGRLTNITNNVITIPDKDWTDEIYNGDSIIIAGTDDSNGTYTAVESTYDEYLNVTYVKVLEDIHSYKDNKVKTYTNLCNVALVEPHQNVTDQYDDVTVLHLTGKYSQFLPDGLSINITNLGMDGNCNVLKSTYNRETGETLVYVRKVLVDTLNTTKKLQVIVETENCTTVSKISNHTFTDFFIKEGFKDIYTTVPCTKTVNALKGARVWIALPNIEENIEFYINSEKVDMDIMEGIDLGMYAVGGAKLYYNVYLSKDEYNSNSVTLEVRRKL